MAEREAGKQPAPNAYNRDAKTATMKRNPAFGFGSASNRPKTQGNEFVPGPGTYRHQSVSDSHGKTLGSKIEQVKTSNMFTPGPGTYNARFFGNQ
jgi:hypothetical protein